MRREAPLAGSTSGKLYLTPRTVYLHMPDRIHVPWIKSLTRRCTSGISSGPLLMWRTTVYPATALTVALMHIRMKYASAKPGRLGESPAMLSAREIGPLMDLDLVHERYERGETQ